MKNEDSYGNKSNKFIIIDDLLKICDIMYSILWHIFPKRKMCYKIIVPNF